MTEHNHATVPEDVSNSKFTAFRTQTLIESTNDEDWINTIFGDITDIKQELLLLVELARVKDDLTVAVNTYKNDLPRLCQHLRVLDGILYRTLGVPPNPAWRTPRQKIWLLNQVVGSFSGVVSVFQVLKVSSSMPFDEGVLKKSAERIENAFDLNGEGLSPQEQNDREESLLGMDGLTHSEQIAVFEAYVSNRDPGVPPLPVPAAPTVTGTVNPMAIQSVAPASSESDAPDEVDHVTFDQIKERLKRNGKKVETKTVQNLYSRNRSAWGEPIAKGPNGSFQFEWKSVAPFLEKNYGIKFVSNDSIRKN